MKKPKDHGAELYRLTRDMLKKGECTRADIEKWRARHLRIIEASKVSAAIYEEVLKELAVEETLRREAGTVP